MASAAAPLEIAETLVDRLKAAQVAHHDAQEVATRKAKALRALVVEAIDGGMKQGDLAKLLGVARSRIHKIMVTEYSQP